MESGWNPLANEHKIAIYCPMLITSPEAMIDLGMQLAKEGKTHILLYGDLGAGKTHFVK